jgi:hypothetical protein
MDLHCQTCLDSGIAIDGLSPELAKLHLRPRHSRANQIFRDPRRLNSLLYVGQCRVLYISVVALIMASDYHAGFK